MKSFDVIKSTGEREKFKLSKLKQSLGNAGAQPPVIKAVVNHLEETGYFRDDITTKEIYREAYRLLKKNSKRVARRYKLKESLLELGPSGYPFEVLISEVFRSLGYKTEVGETVQGKCVSHEIDVIAQDEQEIFMIECKFHNRKDHHCNVTIPLYVQSRFLDVSETWKTDSNLKNKKSCGFIATNTRFTQDAIDYAACSGMKLLSWNYPKGQGLRSLIEETQIHPITALLSLTRKEKQSLLNEDIVHCKQLLDQQEVLNQLRFSHSKRSKIIKEAEEVCTV
ncbi:restriction endonuclease [Gracilimonas sediminicola]|uniref:Restriction endonuclease n=1 Tax=Gracilimonas sediminicola TaxID=2952158 RepID=A0A9X2L380_9BACT|nr:restriction endonuclease [Gracilimonas sediminicola]MCP9291410.1 restriction endonuclease [Gracilimonas sediminicola]